jgi:hypothetical protein
MSAEEETATPEPPPVLHSAETWALPPELAGKTPRRVRREAFTLYLTLLNFCGALLLAWPILYVARGLFDKPPAPSTHQLFRETPAAAAGQITHLYHYPGYVWANGPHQGEQVLPSYKVQYAFNPRNRGTRPEGYVHSIPLSAELYGTLREGQAIKVYFNPRDPDESEPDLGPEPPHDFTFRPPPWVLKLLVSGLPYGLMAWAYIAYYRRESRLLRKGIAVQATVSAGPVYTVDIGLQYWTYSSSPRRYYQARTLTYSFKTREGVVVRRQEDDVKDRLCHLRVAAATALYDPKDPERNTLYPLSSTQLRDEPRLHSKLYMEKQEHNWRMAQARAAALRAAGTAPVSVRETPPPAPVRRVTRSASAYLPPVPVSAAMNAAAWGLLLFWLLALADTVYVLAVGYDDFYQSRTMRLACGSLALVALALPLLATRQLLLACGAWRESGSAACPEGIAPGLLFFMGTAAWVLALPCAFALAVQLPYVANAFEGQPFRTTFLVLQKHQEGKCNDVLTEADENVGNRAFSVCVSADDYAATEPGDPLTLTGRRSDLGVEVNGYALQKH